MNILEAMTDDALFGREFGGDSWAAWRALLGGFYGVDGIDADVFRSLTQREPGGPWQELWLPMGRRGGKSRAAALIAVYEAVFSDHRSKLAPGEVATVFVVAADRRQARVVHGYIRGMLNSNPMLRKMVRRETAEIIELSTGCAIEIGTASFRSIRGYSISCAILDEIAFWMVDGASPDAEVLSGIRPALATLKGRLVALSSPYAKKGALWNTFKRHFGGDSSRILVARAASLAMNPTLDPQTIADAMEEDPAAARAEWLGEFRGDLEVYVPRELVEAAVEPGCRVRAPLATCRYEAFVDPSGGASDSMTLGIAHREKDRAVLDCLVERRAPFSPESAVEEFAAVLRNYRISTVRGDRYGGSWPSESFLRHGIRYEPAEKTKSQIYVDFLPMLTSGKADLLDEPRLISQLSSLERRTARGGRDSVDHPVGGIDDLANAASGVLASVGAARGGYAISTRIRGLG